MVKGDCIRVGSGGLVGRVHGVWLRDTKELADESSGQFLAWAMGGEIAAVKSLSNEGG